jgi:PAS domain S-box-containing protein
MNPARRRSLLRFVILFVSIGVPLLALVYVPVRTALRGAREAAARQGVAQATLAATGIDEHLRGIASYLEAYARNPALRGAVERHDEEQARIVLTEAGRSNTRVDRVFLTDRAGIEWSDYPHDPKVIGKSFAHRDWYRGVARTETTYVSSVYRRAAGQQEKTVGIATPIRDRHGTVLGFLVCQVLASSLERAIPPAHPDGGTEILILDREGSIVTVDPSPTGERIKSALPALIPLPEGGASVEVTPEGGEPHMVAHAGVRSMAGSVIAFRNMNAAIAAPRMLAGGIYAFALVLAALLAGLVNAVLERRSRRIESLREVERDLEAQVAERTESLSTTVRRLQLEIAERRRAESSLQKSEARFRATFEQAAVGIAHFSAEGRWYRVNQKLCEIVGFAREDLLALPLGAVIRLDDATDGVDLLSRLGEWRQGTCTVERELWRSDGSTVWCHLTVGPVLDMEGRPDYYQAVVEDISGRKRLEEQFLQSQKMRAIGQLAGGIAHDFNNLLTTVMGYSELIERRMPETDPLRHYVEEIRKAGERASSLTAQLLAFSRKQILKPVPLDLNDAVQRMDRLLRRLIGEDVTLTTRLAPDLGAVRADPGQIEQVVMNLVVNARDAMPQGGRVTVETGNVRLEADQVERFPGLAQGWYAMLAVIDTGTGMDRSVQSRLFEPFFTTKEKGKGTGLGLSTVYGIVKQSGGAVAVESEPGKGSAFRVYLPRTDARPEPSRADPVAASGARVAETVLVVEDDDGLLALTKRVLEEAGYVVLEARGGADAVEKCGRYRGPIHLVLTDVVMPQMSGLALSQQIESLHPEAKVLYMSGYTDEAIEAPEPKRADLRFLQKPFTTATLLQAVRAAIDSKPDAPAPRPDGPALAHPGASRG